MEYLENLNLEPPQPQYESPGVKLSIALTNFLETEDQVADHFRGVALNYYLEEMTTKGRDEIAAFDFYMGYVKYKAKEIFLHLTTAPLQAIKDSQGNEIPIHCSAFSFIDEALNQVDWIDVTAYFWQGIKEKGDAMITKAKQERDGGNYGYM